MSSATPTGGLRLLELLGAISLATDIGTGQPAFHGVRTAALAMAIARELGADEERVVVVQQVALLRFLGGTADTWGTARMAGGSEPAFLAAMGAVGMGAKTEMARQLLSTVGSDRSPLRRTALVAGAFAD